ncbi:MAG: ABC transporter ATP-binding protein, partial [Streptosporangiaceae bacterium]
GKTTAIRIMLGLLAADHGRARLFGIRPRDAIAAGQVGAILQDAELMSGVTVGALLRFIRGIYPSPLEYEAAIKVTGVEQVLGRRTDRLSTGQAQRVQFAAALIGNPRLLVLDEPTAGLDVQAQQVFWEDVRSYRARGQTVLFSTHYLEEADQNADRIVVIQSGHTVADGTPEQVRSAGGSPKVVRFTWLGETLAELGHLPGVSAVDHEGRQVTLHTTDPDATVWALYPFRQDISGLEATGGGLREAFLALTSRQAPEDDAIAAGAGAVGVDERPLA